MRESQIFNTKVGFPALACLALSATSVDAQFVAYHDFGAFDGEESTGFITTHQSATTPATLDLTPKALINYADGSATGVTFSVNQGNGMDPRNAGETAPPDAATPADPLFNVPGLNLGSGLFFVGNNTGPAGRFDDLTITLTGLNPGLFYDLALYGHRNAGSDGAERFTLGGADAAANSSSTGVVDASNTDMQTRPNTGDVVRWTGIDPGADGTITVLVDPGFDGVATNLAYLSALRIEATTDTDTTAPTISSTNPADAATDVVVSANLVATFDESIALGDSGDVTIKNLTEGTDLVISLGGADPDGTLSASGTDLIIDPAVDLDLGDEYAIEIRATVVKDAAGNFYDGILVTDDPNWSFTTLPPLVASWFAYHDFGATTGDESTGFITTHQSGDGATSNTPLDSSAKALIDYVDGSATGVSFSIDQANGMDSRNGGEIAPPAASTPADAIFNVAGLNLNNGTIFVGNPAGGADRLPNMTITLSGLNPALLYDLAFYGNRVNTEDGVERFTLGGADAATNSSSTGIVDDSNTDMQTRPNTDDVVRWSNIDPGADGTITVFVDPGVTSTSNIAYLSAMRLAEVAGAAADTFADWIADPAFGLDPGDQGFEDDPDGDNLDSGIEAWFGTNPAVANSGLTQVSHVGGVLSFEHPQAVPALSDVSGSYEWSLDLVTWHPDTTTTVGDTTVTITPVTNSGITTVEADTTGSTVLPTKLFLRAVATQN